MPPKFIPPLPDQVLFANGATSRAVKPLLQVVCAVIIDNGKLLLAQCGPNMRHAGLWEFVGGKIELRETPFDAVVREVKEELGLKATPGIVLANHIVHHNGQGINLIPITVTVANGPIRLFQHQAATWFTLPEALALPMADADMQILIEVKRCRVV